MSLGEKIQQLRKARGMSQEQLADTLNVSRQAISKWETDQSSPEIEKILALSRVFSVSTDELLGNDLAGGAGADFAQSGGESGRAPDATRLAGHLNQMAGYFGAAVNFMDRKIILILFTLLCLIGAGVCFIVNYALDGQVTWAAYPFISIPLGWLLAVPLLFRKLWAALCVLTLTAAPFLYLMDRITPAPSWFFGIGLPCAIAGTVFLWVVYLLFRFIRISAWYKAAISFFLAGMIVSPLVNHFVDRFLGTGPSIFNIYTNIFSCLLLSALFFALGYMRNKVKSAGNK